MSPPAWSGRRDPVPSIHAPSAAWECDSRKSRKLTVHSSATWSPAIIDPEAKENNRGRNNSACVRRQSVRTCFGPRKCAPCRRPILDVPRSDNGDILVGGSEDPAWGFSREIVASTLVDSQPRIGRSGGQGWRPSLAIQHPGVQVTRCALCPPDQVRSHSIRDDFRSIEDLPCFPCDEVHVLARRRAIR